MPPNFIQFELYKLETICGLVGRETYGCYSVLKYILFNAELQTLYLQRLYFFLNKLLQRLHMTVASIDKYVVYITILIENHKRK